MGFFDTADIESTPPVSTIPQCGKCGLCRICESPKMPPTGRGRRKVLIVAESPGKAEDEQGIQLVGKSGQKLREVLSSIDVDLDRDCWKTNSVICRPKDNKMEEKFIQCCRPNLNKTIEKLRPETVVLLGGSAVSSLIGQHWKRGIGPLETWTGWTIPCRDLNTWICVTYHPSYLLRENNPVLELWFRKHLQDAFSLDGRPHQGKVENLANNIQIEISPSAAAKQIRSRIKEPGPIAFDYETNMLKPDKSESEIVSCSIAWEDYTIAYPWEGPAIEATSEILRSPVPKIGANLKFEQRWTQAKLGHNVRGWLHDNMQCAHVLDNRRGITSVKFQAFAKLGITPWDDHIRPLLEAKGGYKKNRIREIPLRDLLLYNGLDSCIELMLWKKQLEEIENERDRLP